jgi:hypothetical protein
MKVHEHPILREQWPPVPESTAMASNKSVAGNLDIVDAMYFHPGGGRWPADVTLRTSYAGRRYARDIFLDVEQFAERLASLLKQHIGYTVENLENWRSVDVNRQTRNFS